LIILGDFSWANLTCLVIDIETTHKQDIDSYYMHRGWDVKEYSIEHEEVPIDPHDQQIEVLHKRVVRID
jgi:hypothetical protein